MGLLKGSKFIHIEYDTAGSASGGAPVQSLRACLLLSGIHANQ